MKQLQTGYSRTFTSYLYNQILGLSEPRHDIDDAHRVTHHLIALGRSLPYVRPDVLARGLRIASGVIWALHCLVVLAMK